MSQDNIIINPLTQRPIKIGGRVYIGLVKDGVISCSNDLLQNELTTYSSDSDIDLQEVIKKCNDNILHDSIHAVKGRGKHKGKIVTRRKPIIRHTNSKVSNSLLKHCKYKIVEKEPKHQDSESDSDFEELQNMALLSSSSDDEDNDDDESEYSA